MGHAKNHVTHLDLRMLIYVAMIAAVFLGCLTLGKMSFWGATVITSLLEQFQLLESHFKLGF